MNSEPTKKEPPIYEPNVGIRLLWWFGIYFGAQLPLIMYFPYAFWFPMGLISPFVQSFLPPPTESIYLPYLLRYTAAFPFSYGFYGLHFVLTVLLPSRKTFRVLMIILIVGVVINLVGCMRAVDFHLLPQSSCK